MFSAEPDAYAGLLHPPRPAEPSVPPERKALPLGRRRQKNGFGVGVLTCSLVIAAVISNAAKSLAQAAGAPAAAGIYAPQSAPGSAQNPTAVAPLGSLSTPAGLGDGPILPGDTIEVQVFDAPELSVKALVSQSGDIPVPLLKVFHIAGMTSSEAAEALSHAFKNGNFLENPNILVTVQQSANGITVAGEVRVPGVYPATGKHRLIDVLTRAGGPTENAAHVVEITGPESGEVQRVIWDPTFQENPAIGVYLEAGQTVLVGKCGVAYLGGNLSRPGAYSLCGSRHTTLSEAIALAGGLRPSSAANRAVLLRSEKGTRTVRTVNVEDILRGKSPDFTLNSDDIFYVPSSALKAGAKTIAQSALNFAAVVGAYRLQY